MTGHGLFNRLLGMADAPDSTLDLNADLGESFSAWTMGDDEALLDVVSSANIACGFHAGDPPVLLRTVRAAHERGVRIGAHVAYRDLAGFGRRFVDATPDELYADVLYQIAAITGIARVVGASVQYVKPHGALYNTIVHHEAQATAVVRACRDSGLALMGLPDALALRLAEDAGVPVLREAFADRAYTAEGTLVSRRLPGAVLHDADEVAARMVRLAREGVITSIDGVDVPVRADSVCVHGDSPGAVAMARAVREALGAAGVRVQA